MPRVFSTKLRQIGARGHGEQLRPAHRRWETRGVLHTPRSAFRAP